MPEDTHRPYDDRPPVDIDTDLLPEPLSSRSRGVRALLAPHEARGIRPQRRRSRHRGSVRVSGAR